MLLNEDPELLKNVDTFILDMDGTFYIGNNLLPGAIEFVEIVRESGKDFIFLTNNSSANSEQYADKIRRMGISGEIKVFTSGEATAIYIRRKMKVERLFVLGTPCLKDLFKSYGFEVVNPGRFGECVADPDAIILGFDKTLTYESINAFCRFVMMGKPYVATHPDPNCPDEDFPIPDAGAMIEFVRTATGRGPDVIIGKPNPFILDSMIEKFHLTRERMAFIGDRLMTDMKLANNSGIISILLLSGETKMEDIGKTDVKVDYIFENLLELVDVLRKFEEVKE